MRGLYANMGRGKPATVTRSWQALADRAETRDVDFAVFVEVDEGDQGYSDHAIIRRMFTGWRLRFMRLMVVILVNPRHEVTDAESTKSGDGVRRWSPVRYVNELRIPATDGPATTVIGVHYAAGYKNGQRPAWAVPLLGASWNLTRLVHKRRVHAAIRRGDHVITLADTNDHNFDASYLHPSAVVLFGPGGSDWGVAVPARGWQVVSHRDRRVETFVERFHQGHETTVKFGPAPS